MFVIPFGLMPSRLLSLPHVFRQMNPLGGRLWLYFCQVASQPLSLGTHFTAILPYNQTQGPLLGKPKNLPVASTGPAIFSCCPSSQGSQRVQGLGPKLYPEGKIKSKTQGEERTRLKLNRWKEKVRLRKLPSCDMEPLPTLHLLSLVAWLANLNS